jgi:hypothetical protein
MIQLIFRWLSAWREGRGRREEGGGLTEEMPFIANRIKMINLERFLFN